MKKSVPSPIYLRLRTEIDFAGWNPSFFTAVPLQSFFAAYTIL